MRNAKTSWSLLQNSTSEDFQPQLDEGGSTCSLERGQCYTSSKERQRQEENPRSYRPISLLSCVGKLLERMVNWRLINHLESNNELSPTQTGYRKFRSTEDQLTYLAQNIEDAFQEKRKVLAVFFDLSNAFDKVWKEGLLVKLLRTGMRCKMYMWIQHFLFARTARVKLDGILNKKSLPS